MVTLAEASVFDSSPLPSGDLTPVLVSSDPTVDFIDEDSILSCGDPVPPLAFAEPPHTSSRPPAGASTSSSAAAGESTSPPSSSAAPPAAPPSASRLQQSSSDPLPAGGATRGEQLFQVASQSLQQQQASRLLLASVSQSLEALAQSVQLLVETQQEFVQESLTLQRETVDILRDFSNTALSMLGDKSNGQTRL